MTVTIVVAMVGNLYFDSSIKEATIEILKISMKSNYKQGSPLRTSVIFKG